MTKAEPQMVSEKWFCVYQTIPEDTHDSVRFKDIAKVLPHFSRSTISAALKYLESSGLVIRNQKSKKISCV